MIVIGIDPGVSGAIAFLHPDRVTVHDLPTVPVESGTVTKRVHGPALASLIRANCPKGVPILAAIEDLSAGGSRPRPGEKLGASAQTVGSQYRTRGTIEATLEMLGLDVKPVMAQRWKKLYGYGKEKKTAAVIAVELYPELEPDLARVKDHNRAEAVLIANWARKVLAC